MTDYRPAIRAFMKDRGLKISPWAKSSKVVESTLREYLSGKHKSIQLDTLQKLAASQGATVEELIAYSDRSVEGERYSSESNVPALAMDEPRNFRRPDGIGYLPVPVYDQRVSAGSGAVAIDGSPIDFLMFREQWLRSVSTNIKRLFVLEITGDSDWPFLHSGDHALVDPGQQNPAREGRYVIRIDNELLVKIISVNPKTRLLTVKSGNPDYPSYDNLPPDSVDIIGRVVWIARRIA